MLSHHIGDLENAETLRSCTEGIRHLSALFGIEPAVIAHDLHPEYLSTKYALDRAGADGLDLIGVQHHHAHIASCLADHGAGGPVIGVAFDGTGYGPDGTIWGGEFLVAGPVLLQIGARPDLLAEPLAPGGGWVTLGEIGPPSARPVTTTASGLPIVLCSVRGTLYAYQDGCAACGSALGDGRLDREVLTCSCGAAYDVSRAGRGLGDAAAVRS